MSEASRVRVYLGCSLDGCIAGPNHDISFLNEEPEGVDAGEPEAGLGFAAFMDQVGALLMGRNTYQVPLDYDAWHYGERPVLVATHRELPPAPQGGTAWAVQGDIRDLIAQAKDAAGDKDVYLDGGDLVRQGLDAGLVDEVCLTVLPLILGQGIRLWEGLQTRTDLVFEAPVVRGRFVQVTAQVKR